MDGTGWMHRDSKHMSVEIFRLTAFLFWPSMKMRYPIRLQSLRRLWCWIQWWCWSNNENVHDDDQNNNDDQKTMMTKNDDDKKQWWKRSFTCLPSMRRFVELAHHLLHLPVQYHDDKDGDNDDGDFHHDRNVRLWERLSPITLPIMIISLTDWFSRKTRNTIEQIWILLLTLPIRIGQ